MTAWDNFYVIVGSSGGALIGLQFVVITLIADRRDGPPHTAALSAFGTPTVVHLVGALVVSALMSVPWPSLLPLSVCLGISGASGLVYGGVVIRRARRQTEYTPVWQDWVWYGALPCTTYAALAVTAFVLPAHSRNALFVVGASTLGLLLIGIHNAWDSVTHLVMFQNERR